MFLLNKPLPKFDLPVDFLAGEDDFQQVLSYYSHFPCKIKCCVFVLIKEGSVRVTVNHVEYNLKAGDLVTVIPDSFIQIQEIEGNLRLVLAGFSSVFMEKVNLAIFGLDYAPVIRENIAIHLTDEQYVYYEDYFRLLMKSHGMKAFCESEEVLKHTLLLTLQQVAELYKLRFGWEKNKQNREKEIFIEFLRFLNKHYKEEHSVSFYASKIGVSLPHFCKTIKHATGRTPSDILNDTLIMDAKSHLKSTTLSVKQIAFLLGFKNIGFFYKFFKHHTGVTPQQYRDEEPLKTEQSLASLLHAGLSAAPSKRIHHPSLAE